MGHSMRVRVALAVGGVFVALTVVLFTAIHLPFARRAALDQARQFAADAGFGFEAENLDYNLLTGHISLQGIVVRAKGAADPTPLFRADLLEVNLSLRRLLGRRLHVEDGRLVRPQLAAIYLANSGSNLPARADDQPTVDEPSGQPFAWSIGRFTLQQGSLLFEDRRLPVSVSLPGWSLDLSEGDGGRTQVTFEADQTGLLNWRGRESNIGGLTIQGSLSSQNLDLSNIRLELPEMGAAGVGSASFGGNPVELAVDFALDAEVARLAQYFEVEQDVAGPVVLELRGGGSLDAISLTAAMRSDAFRYQSLDGMVLDLEAGWTVGSDVLELPRANVTSSFGEVEASGRIAIDDAAVSSITAAVRGLHLARLTREFGASVIVASTAAGDLEFRWQGTAADQAIESLSGFADLRLVPTLVAPRQNVVPLAGNVRLRAADGLSTISLTSLSALGTSWNGAVRVDPQHRLSGQVTGESADVGASYVGLQSFRGVPLDEPALEIAGRLDAALSVSGSLAQPKVGATLTGANLTAGEIRDAAMTVSAVYADDQIRIEAADLEWADQSATLTGAVEVSGSETVVDLAFAASGLSIGAVRSALGYETLIDGVLDVQGSLNGSMEAPTGQASISGDGLIAYGQPFGALASELAFRDGVALLNSFRLHQGPDGASGELAATGEYRFEDGEFSLLVEGRNVNLEQLDISGQEPPGGVLSLDLTASGTFGEPELRGEASLVGASYAGRELGELRLDLSTRTGRAQIAAQAAKFNAAFAADIGLAAPYPGTLRAELTDVDLGQLGLRGPKGDAVSGTLSATLTAEGEVDNWRDADVRLILRDAVVQAIERLPLQTNGDVILRYEGRRLTADQATISVGHSTFEIGGRLPLEQPSLEDRYTVRGNLDLNELASFIPSDTAIGASGRSELDATIGGSLTALVPEGEIRLLEAAVFNQAMVSPLTSLNGTVRLAGATVELRGLTGGWAGAQLEVSGSAPLALLGVGDPGLSPKPFRVDWSLNGLVIDSLTSLPRGTGGTVSIGGNIQGLTPEVEALEGIVEIAELDVYYDAVRASQPQPSRLRLSNGVLTVESFELRGANLRASLAGDVHLLPAPTLNLDFSVDTDAAVLALAADGISATGPIQFRVAARGSTDSPELTGEMKWAQGEIASSQAGLAAQELDLQVALTPGSAVIQRFTGTLNGGGLEVSGNIDYVGTELGKVDLAVKADAVFLEIPEGLRTVSNADLTIRSRDDNIVIGGRIVVEEGVYREPLEFDLLLLDLLRSSGGATAFVSEPNALLARTRFNVEVESVNPIVVDNNIAKLGAALDLRLTGSYYRPGLVGRVELEEGGELYISENRYFVDRGVVDFLNEGRIQPTFDVLARTKVRNQYDIELAITGGGVEPVATRLSSPSHDDLGEPDLISLLLTGRLREDLRGEEVNVAAEQSLSYLTGRIGGRLSRAAQDTLGLSEVRIEPNLIAAESDPGARLTVGQNLSPDVSLVYSMNLADSSDQIWTVRYDLTRRFQARGVRQADDTYRLDFQHDVRFGGGQDAGRVRRSPRAERLIGMVTVTGEHPLSEDEILSMLGLKAGRPYDFFTISKGSDKIERRLVSQGYLEAKVSIRRELKEATVDLQVTVEAGPRVNLIYEGWSASGELKKQVRQLWSNGVFDAQRLDDARRAILADLTDRGYLAAEFRTEVTARPDGEKRVLFEIQLNTRFEDIGLVFEGVNAFSGKDLRKQLQTQGLLGGIYVDSAKARTFVENLYRAEGYLDIQVDPARQELDAVKRTARVVVPISEGRQYRVSELAFSGNQKLTEAQLRRAANLTTGVVYNAALLQELFLRLEEEYWRAGFQDVELEFQMEKGESEPTIRISARIEENRQSVIERFEIAGVRATSEKLALSQLGIEPGEPLNFEQSTRGRRALYDTGAYTLVDLSYSPIEQPNTASDPALKPLTAVLRLREVKPFQIRYGGFFDSEHGPGGILDFRNRNTFGAARMVGARLRADNEFQEARVFFSQPLLRRFPLSTNFVTFVSRTKRPGEFFDETDRRSGFSVSQETRWQNHYILNYGYRFEKLVSVQNPPDPFFPDPIRLNVAPFTVSFRRETRDDILDASRGDFLSNTFEWAPTQLGGESSLHFIRYFGQYFRYFPLSEPAAMPFQKTAQRSRWVYATGARIGLSRGLNGQVIPDAEKFFAGGGTTIRGFKEDQLGGTDFFGPVGGNAVFMLNNELRFPIRWMFDGVAFLDVGNVYERVSDFSLTGLRKSSGFGLRLRTPFFLIRADYGVKLDRRPGESAGQFFFSIGQAF